MGDRASEEPVHLMTRIKELEAQETHILEKLLENDEAFKRREAELLAQVSDLHRRNAELRAQVALKESSGETERKDELIDLVVKQKYELLVKEHSSLERKFAEVSKELAKKSAGLEGKYKDKDTINDNDKDTKGGSAVDKLKVELEAEKERSRALSRENEQLRKFEHVYNEVVHTVDEELTQHSDIEEDLLQKIKELKAFEQQQTALRKEIVTQCSNIREDLETEHAQEEERDAERRAAFTAEGNELRKELKDMDAKLQVYKEAAEQKERLESEVARLNQSLNEANSTLDITLTEVTNKSDEVLELKTLLEERSQRVTSVESQLEESLKELEKARSENRSLNEQLDASNETAETLTATRQQLERLEDDHKVALDKTLDLEREIERHKEQLSEEQAKFAQLENLGKVRLQAVEQATERYRELEARFEKASERAEEQTRRAEAANKKYTQAQTDASYAVEAREKLEGQIVALREDVEILQEEKRGLEGAFNDKSEVIQEQLKTLTHENAAKAKAIDELADVIAGVKAGKQVFDWESLADQDLPPPPCGMESAAIQFILRAWTENERKIAITNKWCGKIIGGEPIAAKKSVTFENLSTEVREGFLKLIVPLLKKRADVDIHVESRPVISGTCLRLTVQPNVM